MKQLNISANIWFLLMTLSAVVSLTSCTKPASQTHSGNKGNPPSNLTISRVYPTSGSYETGLKIAGTGFDSDMANDSVYINGVAAVMYSANDSLLVAIVQKYTGTGDVVIKVDGVQLTGPVFTYNYTVLGQPYAGVPNTNPYLNGHTDGPADEAIFAFPMGLALDKNNDLYVYDAGNGKIREVTPPGSSGGSQVSTLYTVGTPVNISGHDLAYPWGLAFNGSAFYLGGINIRLPPSPGGTSETEFIPAPNDGVGGETLFPLSNYVPQAVFMDKAGNIYATSQTNVVIIYNNGPVSWTFIGSDQKGNQDGNWLLEQENQPNPAIEPAFNTPDGIVVDSSGNIFVTDQVNNNIRKITPTGVVTTFAGSGANVDQDGTGTAASLYGPSLITIDGHDNMYVFDNGTSLRKITPAGVVSTLCVECTALGLTGMVIDSAGRNLYGSVNADMIDLFEIF
jgi:hypothetical protein